MTYWLKMDIALTCTGIFLKTNRDEINLDPCLTSVNILESKVRSYLNKKEIYNIWFPEHYTGTQSSTLKSIDSEKVVHVVLMGDFLRKFFQSGNWIFENLHFWVLCNRSKKVMVELLGLPENTVSVIPRYKLFPIKDTSLKSKSSKVDFVYSGRISASKNIKFLLALISELQTTYSLDCTLNFYGWYDTDFPENEGRRQEFNYPEMIDSFVKKLKWSEPPLFHGKKGSEDWISDKLENPILLNFSTYTSEDFGVSIAQAQSNHWPSVLSAWGGHLDATEGKVLFINSSWIPHDHHRDPTIVCLAKTIGKFVFNKFSCENLESSPSKRASHPLETETITITSLDKIRRNISKKIGLETPMLGRDRMDLFCDSNSGHWFIKQYEHFFSKSAGKKIIIIDHDLESNHSHVDNLNSFINNLEYDPDIDLMMISSKDIFLKYNILALSKAEKIIITFDLEESPKLKKYFSSFDNLIYQRK